VNHNLAQFFLEFLAASLYVYFFNIKIFQRKKKEKKEIKEKFSL
jgi:uncharacterized protein (DUF2164 family)